MTAGGEIGENFPFLHITWHWVLVVCMPISPFICSCAGWNVSDTGELLVCFKIGWLNSIVVSVCTCVVIVGYVGMGARAWYVPMRG